MARAWSFLTLENRARQYEGNEGYGDQLDSHYPFDSTVANHGKPSPGDLAVLRDGQVVLGVGWIDLIDRSPGQKLRLRCPSCSKTGFKRRKSLTPAYHCSSCGATFDEPQRELLSVTQYVARYARTFAPVDGIVTVADLAPAYHGRATQHAIRELDLGRARAIFGSAVTQSEPYWDEAEGVRPAISGGVQQRLGRYRFGQQKFRELLLARFGEACAFTGPQPAAALDAAHLYRYCEIPEHRTDAGLLLRRDLHGLFDRWLISVDPGTWRIQVAPTLHRFPHLLELHDAPLRVPTALRPDGRHVATHYALATTGWQCRP